ncbi:MAG TPA: AgmX/PglI C-terminal domain-containing protein, partial [Candidatus Coatesbacteria bacterium]|nr:AgmX/PglI C-terminal domain-containing protein [Candidatus Coatesbacteria bacterium]
LVVRETLREPELVRALIERMSRWFFVPNRDEKHPGTVSCVYPFVFSTRVFYSPVVVEPLREGVEVPPGRRPYWIDREISPKVRELEDIYSVYLLANPRLAGTITFEFVLSSAGAVERVSVVENTTGAASLAGDVAAKISRWSFTPLEERGPEQDVVVTYPIVFGAGRVED